MSSGQTSSGPVSRKVVKKSVPQSLLDRVVNRIKADAFATPVRIDEAIFTRLVATLSHAKPNQI